MILLRNEKRRVLFKDTLLFLPFWGRGKPKAPFVLPPHRIFKKRNYISFPWEEIFLEYKTLLAAGGDRRQLALLPVLRRGSWRLDTLGLGEGEASGFSYDGLVLPLPALRNEKVPTLEGPPLELIPLLSRLKPGALVVGGSFSAKSRQTIQSLGYPVEDVMERERLVWENAKLTAQAVPVLLGMEDGIFLRGKSVLVMGGGRVARALWPVLKERGAVVSAAARNPAQLALAEQAGVKAVPFAEMEPALGQADLVINTIPAPVIGRRELAALEEGTLVLDLASAPGGVDFAAAKEYFIPARLELGLPGKWFPVQAGRLLGETVWEILEEHWEKGGNRQ